jgi:hypothetical protein
MIPLVLKQKAGFLNLYPSQPVIIRDFRGKLFYSTEGLRPVQKFNLPEGQYYIDQGKIKMIRFIPPKLNRLPTPERNLKPPFNFSIVFDYNPNKCTIRWKEKIIVFDNSLRDYTLPELYFILFHEYSHALYKTERFADLCSANMMLIKGFNPSQIGAAPITSLSEKQLNRKKFVVNNLIRKRRKKFNTYLPLFLLPGI